MPTLTESTLKVGASFVDAAYMGNAKVYDGLPPQVRAIFANPSLECHLYMPGIGMMSGFAAGNYEDSVGTINASVDGLVGLQLDAAGSVGPELVVNGSNLINAANWASGQGALLTAIGGSLRVTSTGVLDPWGLQTIPTIPGAAYLLSCEVSNVVSSGRVSLTNDFAIQAYTPSGAGGKLQFVFKAGFATTNIQVKLADSGGGVSGARAEFSAISCKQIIGIHATQATTGNKPRLRQSNGKYYHEFDGADYLSLGAPLFQMSDDHCVIAGFEVPSNISGWKVPFSGSFNSTSQHRAAALVIEDGTGRVFAEWQAGANVLITSADSYAGQNVVLSARSVSGLKSAKCNGICIGSSPTALSADTFNSANIGVSANGAYHRGRLYPVLTIKGTVSDTDLVILEKFIASLSGVTL